MKIFARHYLLAILGFAGMVGCDTSLTTFYKPGVAVSRLQTDQTRCEVDALKDAPVANEIRQRPPVYLPGRRVCNSAGQCWTNPGYWVDGGFYTVDVNTDLRKRVLDMCMAGKGYEPITIPACSLQVREAVAPRQTTALPKLGPTTCVIKYQDKSWQIVTPVVAD
ncbi:hypothetical protein [Falsiphaeobacter marinintestinus]|uniref:hypothetical protein n=1 Tax=Falsiphaeobacter marinintestinus TaxID=1492905 RepID=UPI001FE62D41|nr:hypothetical protein [Phaeobacter marinintestinus]